jgi:hypothetical protein
MRGDRRQGVEFRLIPGKFALKPAFELFEGDFLGIRLVMERDFLGNCSPPPFRRF